MDYESTNNSSRYVAVNQGTRFTDFATLKSVLTERGKTYMRSLALHPIGSDADDTSLIAELGWSEHDTPASRIITLRSPLRLNKVTPSFEGVAASVDAGASTLTLTTPHTWTATSGSLYVWNRTLGSVLLTKTPYTRSGDVLTIFGNLVDAAAAKTAGNVVVVWNTETELSKGGGSSDVLLLPLADVSFAGGIKFRRAGFWVPMPSAVGSGESIYNSWYVKHLPGSFVPVTTVGAYSATGLWWSASKINVVGLIRTASGSMLGTNYGVGTLAAPTMSSGVTSASGGSLPIGTMFRRTTDANNFYFNAALRELWSVVIGQVESPAGQFMWPQGFCAVCAPGASEEVGGLVTGYGNEMVL